jgi:N-acetylneuraminic acid mutarotase
MKTLNILTAGLVSATSTSGTRACRLRSFVRRVTLPLLFLGAGLLLVQPCAADSGFAATGSLAAPRTMHSATLLPNGKVLVAGGLDSSFNNIVVSAELYDPASGTWTGTGDMYHGGLAAHTAILLPNGRVLVAGGGLYSISFQTSDHAELYEPASGTWAQTGPITQFFDRSVTLLPNGNVLLAGGDIGEDSNGVASAELYDPASETSTPTGSLGTARSHHTATLLPNGKVLVTGGYDSSGNLTTSAELYDPASGTWTATGSLNAARLGHTATLLANGKVLVVGGRNSSGGLASAELYDPASGAWTATGSLTTARVGHTATLLPTGKVLLAGGTNGGVLASAELYDPASGAWTATGSLTTARVGHTATLLSNGNVLFAGGVHDTGVLASAELYDPVSPSAQLLNVATRLKVLNGDNVLIGGFIITGTEPKKVLILGIGPSLSQFFSGSLADPTLELYQGNTLLQMNDDWKTDQQAEVEATGAQPSNDLESAIVRTLDPGSYTAILRGKGDTTGIGVVQAYDLNQAANSKFGNIATRGFVDSGDNAMIGGFIIGPASGGSTTVVVRAIGPSLTNFGVSGALSDPTIELHDGNGATIAFNDNWADDANQASIPQSLKPGDPHESALYRVLPPGDYTAIMRGAGNSTGIGLVEVYNVE